MSDAVIPPGRWIGARVPRVEDRRVLLGDARYVADLALPRMVHLAFVRSPLAHARIVSIDVSAARAAPGCLLVLTAAELGTGPLIDAAHNPALPKTPQPGLAAERVRFVGEPVAAVVAETAYLAEDAAELVQVEYEPLEAVLDVEAATREGAPVIHEELGSNVLYRDRQTYGDVEAAFAKADRVFRRRLHTPRAYAAPMETRGGLATYERSSGSMTYWTSTQTPDLIRATLAATVGLPQQRLRVVAPDVGGAFGPKMGPYPEDVVIARAARELARPVRWIEDRRESLQALRQAKEQHVEIEAAVTTEGRILAFRSRFVGDSGAYSSPAETALIEPQLAATMGPSMYDLEAYEYEVVCVLTNKAVVGGYRGVGFTAGHTVRELLLDEVARELAIDPAELRRRNMIHEERLPLRTVNGHELDSGSYHASLERALELIGYEDLRREQAAARAEGRLIGIGVSPYVEPTGYGTKMALLSGFPFTSHDNASVTVDLAGKVRVAAPVTSQGQGQATTLAQVAADALGVGLADVEIVAGDTERTPFGLGSWASRGAVIGTGSIALAARDVRRRLLDVAATLLEASPDDLTIDDSRVHVAGSPDRGIPLGELAGAAYFAPHVRSEGQEPYPSATRFYDPEPTYSNGCFVAVVEVDAATGFVRVLRFAGVEDCGTVLNPMVVEGQVMGAIAQGVGLALLEQVVYDDTGQLQTSTYMDYLLPTATDVPHMDLDHIESPSPCTVGGVKGMGESGLIASPAAIVNAVVDALGPDYRPERLALPLKPENVLRALGQL